VGLHPRQQSIPASTAIATAKYDGKPIYHAIVVCKPGTGMKTWPDDAKGKRVSFADVGSTSGWLIPTAWFKTKGINPKEYFAYSDGATHAANEIAWRRVRWIAPRISTESQRDDGTGQDRPKSATERVDVRSAANDAIACRELRPALWPSGSRASSSASPRRRPRHPAQPLHRVLAASHV
jgi:hypothetical protein